MNWYCLPFFLAITLIDKGKGELLLISLTPLNDTVQITKTQGGRKAEGQSHKPGWCETAVFLAWPSNAQEGVLGRPCPRPHTFTG